MKTLEDYKKKVNKSLHVIEGKIRYLHSRVKGLGSAFKDFQHEITDFMSFTEEHYADHEKRISELEKKLK